MLLQLKFKLKISTIFLYLLIILHAKVARTGNQHDAHILQRAFDDVHVLVQVAGWRLGGVRQEGILKVHAQSLGEAVVTKSQTALQESKQKHVIKEGPKHFWDVLL